MAAFPRLLSLSLLLTTTTVTMTMMTTTTTTMMMMLMTTTTTMTTTWALANGEDSDPAVDFADLLVVVLSQKNPHHERRQNEQLRHIRSQLPFPPEVVFSHRRWNDEFDWTYFPIFPRIHREFPAAKKWILICDEGTRFELRALRTLLDDYDADAKLYVGRAHVDGEYSIIHHFDAPGSVTYADPAFGVLLSRVLLRELVAANVPVEDFDIDAKYTLARFADRLANATVTHDERLCAGRWSRGCATFFVDEPCDGDTLRPDDVLVAVKTCNEFLQTRVAVIKRTWAGDVERLLYFSEREDASVPTIPVHVNTERGHCAKFKAILTELARRADTFKWAFLVDDDTTLGATSLRRMLSCYDWNSTVVVGERYGFRAHSRHGYNYPTGGSGIAFGSRAVVQLATCPFCHCPQPDSPDDMTLGGWMQALRWPLLHHAGLHQAQPDAYHRDYLARVRPVSFHKYPMFGEPEEIYRKWFAQEEQQERARRRSRRQEL